LHITIVNYDRKILIAQAKGLIGAIKRMHHEDNYFRPWMVFIRVNNTELSKISVCGGSVVTRNLGKNSSSTSV